MAELRKAIDQVICFWRELGGKQRLLLAGGAVATLVVLLVFVRQLATPSYKVLLSGLTPADAQSIAAQLAAKNIPHQLDSAGTTLSVPSDQLDAARLEVASQGMPHSGRLGFEIFDKVSWGQTEFDEKVNYQRALEAAQQTGARLLALRSALRISRMGNGEGSIRPMLENLCSQFTEGFDTGDLREARRVLEGTGGRAAARAGE